MSGSVDEEVFREAERDGVLLSMHVQVQCAGCGSVVEGSTELTDPDAVDPDEATTIDVVCPQCSTSAGIRIVIPVVALTGDQTCDLYDDDDDDSDDDFGFVDDGEAPPAE